MTENQNDTETVDALVPGMTGRWLVMTQGGSHVWDLDGMLYTRLPEGRSLAGRFGLDGAPHPITKIGRYPKVGETSIVFFDDPHDPMKYHWRQSSVIKRIERLHAAAEPKPAVSVFAHEGLVIAHGSAALFAVDGANWMTPGEACGVAFRLDEQGDTETAKLLWKAASEADQQAEESA